MSSDNRSWLVDAYITASDRLSALLQGVPHFVWLSVMAGVTRMVIGWLHKPKSGPNTASSKRADEIRQAYRAKQARLKKE